MIRATSRMPATPLASSSAPGARMVFHSCCHVGIFGAHASKCAPMRMIFSGFFLPVNVAVTLTRGFTLYGGVASETKKVSNATEVRDEKEAKVRLMYDAALS